MAVRENSFAYGTLKQIIERHTVTKKGIGTITIVGHDEIDADAFLSGVMMSRLLDFLEIKNEFLIFEKIDNNETYRIIKKLFGIDMKDYYSEEQSKHRKIFLIDHFKTRCKGKVIACIDHHATDKTIGYPFYYFVHSCSTAYTIYKMMEDAGYPVTEEEAKMVLVAMMTDTICFRNTSTIKSEIEEAMQLAEKYNIDFYELEKVCLRLTPVEKMPTISVVLQHLKSHNYNGNRVKSSYVRVDGMVDFATLGEWTETVRKNVENQNLAMWVFIIFDCEKNQTHEFYITKDGFAKTVMTAKFLSRDYDIMPKVENEFFK